MSSSQLTNSIIFQSGWLKAPTSHDCHGHWNHQACTSIWVNYNDLTATSLGIMVNKGNHRPYFRLVTYNNLPRSMLCTQAHWIHGWSLLRRFLSPFRHGFQLGRLYDMSMVSASIPIYLTWNLDVLWCIGIESCRIDIWFGVWYLGKPLMGAFVLRLYCNILPLWWTYLVNGHFRYLRLATWDTPCHHPQVITVS